MPIRGEAVFDVVFSSYTLVFTLCTQFLVFK